MLGADNDGVDTNRLIIIVIFNGNLRFTVGSQIFHLFPLVPDCGEFLEQTDEPVRWSGAYSYPFRGRHNQTSFPGRLLPDLQDFSRTTPCLISRDCS